eukprot:COSAG01_NODE_177_length_22954_cov_28.699554_9_plen_81_part_00
MAVLLYWQIEALHTEAQMRNPSSDFQRWAVGVRQHILSKFDLNQDGRLSKDEFLSNAPQILRTAHELSVDWAAQERPEAD